MADIFISYAREDRSRAELLAKSLKSQGWSVWWDRKIPAGKKFSEVIEEELNAARCVIVLWSIASIKSDFVQTEAAEGAERNILVPAIIDEVKIPFEFKRINAADLTGWKGESNHEGLQELLWSLTRSLGPPKEQVAVPDSHKEVPPQPKEIEPAKPTPPETETVKAKQPGTELNTTATTDLKPPELRRTNRVWKVFAVACAIVLIIAMMWFLIPSKGKIFVDVVPANAIIQILHVNQPFQQGMELKPGKYQMQVSLQDYETEDRWIELNANEEKLIKFDLKKIMPKVGRLFVEAIPDNAAVRILDNQEEFNQGMGLKPGRYKLEASLDGYETRQQVVDIEPGEEKRINFRLAKLPPKVGRLFVETNPGNAAVRILDNLEKFFNQGMSLKPGRYNLEASLDGYETQQQVVEIRPGEEKRINFELAKPPPRVGRLFIETTPVDAKVSVLNIKSKFTQGMGLEAGSYQVEVAAEGYETQRRLIDLEAGSKKPYKFELSKIIGEPSQPQKVFRNSIGMEFVLIPAGSFTMGSRLSTKDLLGQFGGKAEWFEDEHPPHNVKISQSFYLQTTEVSQGQWKKVMGDNPSHFKECGDDCPVENVSWDDVQQFLKKLNQIEKTKNYHLPSEAEWEYACRAGTTTHHSFGDDASKLGEYAWYADNSNNTTHRVATKKPNLWGLFDMHCNVWEWVEDDHHDSYKGAPADGRAWVDNPRGSDRGVRGGGWGGDSRISRSANRGGLRPDHRGDRFGFRLAKSP